ncbi:MAG: hypothetical protein QF735_13920, partial [Phycisphaeraceae bacterium]|nr:hypothetical protein [Phycisphaeraceae bacterium]
RFILELLVGCGAFSVLITGTIIVVLAFEAFKFFSLEAVSFGEFITGTQWSPLLGAKKHFGIWPLITGTLLVTSVAMAVALPLGLITAQCACAASCRPGFTRLAPWCSIKDVISPSEPSARSGYDPMLPDV